MHLEQRLAQRAEYCAEESRWRLATLLVVCRDVLGVHSLSGLWQVMGYLGFSYQRARMYYHSPDEAYEAKLTYVRQIIGRYRPGEVIVLFADELTYYNHATPAADYAPGRQQPKAGLAIGGERSWRAIAALDAFSGALVWEQASKVRTATFVRFLKKVRQTYLQAKVIYLIVDNWPVHFHPDVISALLEQEFPFPYHLPKSWAHLPASSKYRNLQLPIQLVALPTYASWLNPTEKVWRALKQHRLHNHSLANNFKELIERVATFLQGLENPSPKNLSLTGLLKPDGIFSQALALPRAQFDSS